MLSSLLDLMKSPMDQEVQNPRRFSQSAGQAVRCVAIAVRLDVPADACGPAKTPHDQRTTSQLGNVMTAADPVDLVHSELAGSAHSSRNRAPKPSRVTLYHPQESEANPQGAKHMLFRHS